MTAVPVVLISGVDETSMAVVAATLLWDMPNAVAVRHEIDAERSLLVRVLSDASGVLEREEIDIEHACVSCAIREDVVPTLDRIARAGIWGSVLAQLPVTAEATQVCRVIGSAPHEHRHLRIAASIVALDGANACDDLLGEDLLADRNLSTQPDDRRGVGEVACAMVEYADVVVLLGNTPAAARDLVDALRRPSCLTVVTAADIRSADLMRGIHNHQVSEVWAATVRRHPLPKGGASSAWILDLWSERPLHPERLREAIPGLGAGRRRSRGCFWLPTRATQVCAWDGAGGQLSIGPAARWGSRDPLTRLVIVGLDDGRDDLERIFRNCLLNDSEIEQRGKYWDVRLDGFEPWLGSIA